MSSDNLRDRIAAAVDNFYIYDPCWHPDDWKVAVANAVIKALALRQEYDPYLEPELSRHRYVTDWTTDD